LESEIVEKLSKAVEGLEKQTAILNAMFLLQKDSFADLHHELREMKCRLNDMQGEIQK